MNLLLMIIVEVKELVKLGEKNESNNYYNRFQAA